MFTQPQDLYKLGTILFNKNSSLPPTIVQQVNYNEFVDILNLSCIVDLPIKNIWSFFKASITGVLLNSSIIFLVIEMCRRVVLKIQFITNSHFEISIACFFKE